MACLWTNNGVFLLVNILRRRNLFDGILKTACLYTHARNMQTLLLLSFYFLHFTHRRNYSLYYRGQNGASSGIWLLSLLLGKTVSSFPWSSTYAVNRTWAALLTFSSPLQKNSFPIYCQNVLLLDWPACLLIYCLKKKKKIIY